MRAGGGGCSPPRTGVAAGPGEAADRVAHERLLARMAAGEDPAAIEASLAAALRGAELSPPAG
ncbi:hypothetical protein AB0M46_43875 [Dactylosporangium sp. NPDC051485]|uniref:hypothetical protein n=1 Tax=Dactylosporangium sp. NPDC051485 TaxID=3154846 RepID=UPI0034282E97